MTGQRSPVQRTSHILNAASNLLGISLVIIAGLNVSRVARSSLADEVAWLAAIALGASCVLSYLALRADESEARARRVERLADYIFLLGLGALFAAIVTLAISQR
jgi:multisubunit Na+/H+ antiporter MnhB subunit